MIPAGAAAGKNTRIVAGGTHRQNVCVCAVEQNFTSERVRHVLEFDEYKLELEKYKGAVEELGESL